MIKIGICDDEPDCLNNIIQMITQWMETNNMFVQLFSYNNGDALITKCKKEKLDIIFLDIMMPLLNGMDTAKELRDIDKTVLIVFLTSSPEFALDSYSVRATDYCLKPIVYSKIEEILDECAATLKQEAKNIVFKTSCGYEKLYFHDIEYIEVQNKQVLFYLKYEKIVRVSESLRTLESKLLLEDGFFKCHRSYLVYMPNVALFNNTEITTKSGYKIPISRGLGRNFNETYFSFMFHDA